MTCHVITVTAMYTVHCTCNYSVPSQPQTPPCIALLRKHQRVVQNYYLRYMSGFDAQLMRDVVMVRSQTLVVTERGEETQGCNPAVVYRI